MSSCPASQTGSCVDANPLCLQAKYNKMVESATNLMPSKLASSNMAYFVVMNAEGSCLQN